MNFRELTNNECQARRDWIPVDANRTELERKVLNSLDDAKARYLQSGGTVKEKPACTMSENVNYAEMNRAQKAKQAEWRLKSKNGQR